MQVRNRRVELLALLVRQDNIRQVRARASLVPLGKSMRTLMRARNVSIAASVGIRIVVALMEPVRYVFFPLKI